MLRKVLLALALLALAPTAQAQQNTNITRLNSPPITCAVSATLLVSPRYRNAVTIIVPNGGATVYVGSTNGVTTGNGFPIVAGAALTLQPYNGALYCIVGSGTQVISPLESY